MIPVKYLHIIIITLILLNTLDILTTEISLNNGNEELSPIPKYFMEMGMWGKLGLYTASYILFVGIMIFFYKRKEEWSFWFVGGCYILVKLGVVIWNLLVIIRG